MISLSESEQRFACTHELGHVPLHPDANTPFLTKYTYLSVDKYEIEANKFALELLIPDELLSHLKPIDTDYLYRSQEWLCKYINS
ncbi:ImmA/IrrE family metallo-endopeptidase [Gallintestinimicrobium sp.]|uniref:ImmA/IrrE family metallo-endopeptidase n=1 Tax=Gallintestinimicrobium sp. TaxID=2981655 RepID=UPI003AB4D53D